MPVRDATYVLRDLLSQDRPRADESAAANELRANLGLTTQDRRAAGQHRVAPRQERHETVILDRPSVRHHRLSNGV